MTTHFVNGVTTYKDLLKILLALSQTDCDYRTLNLVSQAVTGYSLPEPTQIIVTSPAGMELPRIEVSR
jgi:hypothetical protein